MISPRQRIEDRGLFRKKYTLSGPVISPLQSEDLDHVLDIEKLSFKNPWTKNLFERELSNPVSYAFVLKGADPGEDAAVSGYVIFWIIETEAHILNITVHPACRKKGFGRMLLKYALDTMERKGVFDVYLEVRTTNEPAIALYKSHGFEIVGIRRRYYGDEDAIVMRLCR
ncbi:MAG: ribosomal protein S18-alanine N-acetyltransferase [Deltaproteobacteria bacterium]|nr:ribosomal protein S18-alanine N-acetyltransferase [Deltaproteobacteria bacterium]